MTCGKPVGCSASKGRGSCRMLPCWNKPGFNATQSSARAAPSEAPGSVAHQGMGKKEKKARSARLQLTSSRERSPTGLPFERSSD